MPFDDEALAAIRLTIELAALSTVLLLLLATPLAWWLANTASRWRSAVGAAVMLPLVLPPTVLGFYLLLLLGPKGAVGRITETLGLGALSFTFSGLVVGSIVFSLPFAVQPLQHAFEAGGRRPLEVAATLRASPIDAFFTVALPQARAGILTAAILSFAHTVGEFGVVLMVGGNIPGVTRTLSIAIYDDVQALDYASAGLTSLALVGFAFLVLCATYALQRRVLPL